MEGFGGSWIVGMARGGHCGSNTPLLMEIGKVFVSIMKWQHGNSFAFVLD